MSQLIKHLLFSLFITISFCCAAQQIVQTPKDIFVVCQRENEFIGKPLKDLFKEIKPQIKLVLASGGWAEEAPRFAFIFTSIDVYKKYRQEDKFPISLIVIPKETFDWDWEERHR